MILAGFENERKLTHIDAEFDYVIVGGGLTGVCSAITAAREGLKVALIQDRPILGGNSSSEVRVWVLGATSHMGNNNRWSREGGVIDEIMVENTHRNKEGNPVLYDMVLIDKVLAEPNISLFLNTVVYDIKKSASNRIESVSAFNPQNAKKYTFKGGLFADCTGDGTIGYLAGASYRMGAEDQTLFNEKFAPDKDKYGELLGHSMLFYVKETGAPVKYTAPDFALKDAIKHIPRLQDPNYFDVKQNGCKYWWMEYGGRLDTVGDTEKIKFEIWKVVYGVWDYIKNSGKYPETVNQTLEWVGLISGKRESRRFNGHYMLTQQDVIEQRVHYDGVAYGGWSIDLHPADGVYSPLPGATQWHSKGLYQIPYRCYTTPDIDNLFIGGRIISTSHVANGSSRVMCTAAHGGQAIGMAAALCVKNNLKPADYIDPKRVKVLQDRLAKLGQFIPFLDGRDENNLLNEATIEVSSELKLASLPAGTKMFALDYPAGQLIPVDGAVPKIKIKVTAKKDTTLRVELRSSSKVENFTPDITDAVVERKVAKGVSEIEIDFERRYDSARYAFICFMTNPDITIPMSDLLVSGLVSVFNYINPSVSNWGKQEPTEDIGVEAFEFWCPQRRPDGQNIALSFEPALSAFGSTNMRNTFYRPYIGVNGWVAAPDDNSPTLEVKWGEKRQINELRLFFDTDFDHAMENVQMGHHDAAMPFCLSDYTIYDAVGKKLIEVKGNYQSMNRISLEKTINTDSLKIIFKNNKNNVYPALMGLVIE